MFQSGRQKTGGKQKGYKSPQKTVEELLAQHGFDFWSRMLEVLDELTPAKQMEAMLKIMEYIRPKLSATSTEVTHDIGENAKRLQIERDMLNRLLANPEAMSALKVLEGTRLLEGSTDVYAPENNWAAFPKPQNDNVQSEPVEPKTHNAKPETPTDLPASAKPTIN